MNGAIATRKLATRTSRRRSAAVLLLLLLPIGAVFAQSLETLLERSDFSSAERRAITTVIDIAHDAGVPSDLLLPRLAEGIAKRVPAARITAALRSEVASLAEARELLQAVDAATLLDEPAIWARAANLLQAGLSEETVQRLAIAAEPRHASFRPASALLVSMVDWGLDEEDATALAAAAIASGVEPGEYPIVLELLIEGRASRLPLDEMVTRLLEELPGASSARDLRRSFR